MASEADVQWNGPVGALNWITSIRNLLNDLRAVHMSSQFNRFGALLQDDRNKFSKSGCASVPKKAGFCIIGDLLGDVKYCGLFMRLMFKLCLFAVSGL